MNYVDRRNKPKTKPMSEQDELLENITSTIIQCSHIPLYKAPKDMAKQILGKVKPFIRGSIIQEIINMPHGTTHCDIIQALKDSLDKPTQLMYKLKDENTQLKEKLQHYEQKGRMKNPFEKVLAPKSSGRAAEFNRGCYVGFEKARKEWGK